MTAHDEEVLGKAYDARLMRRLLGYLRPYRLQVCGAMLAIVLHALVELVPPYLTRTAIDEYIPAGDREGLAALALLYFVALLGAFGLEYVQTWTMQMTGQRIMFDIRMQIFGHLQRLDLRFYDRNPVGRLMTRVTTDVDALNELFTAGVVAALGDVFTLLGIMAVLLWLDWQLALVAFSVLPLIVLIAQWFRRNVRESYRRVRTTIARINAFLHERITGMTTVQLFRNETRDFARFDRINREHRDANVQSIFYYAVFYPAIELVSALAAALIIWRGGTWVAQDAFTLGTLVAFFQYSQRFFRPITDLSEKFNIMQGAMASSERIFALLDTPVHIQSPADTDGAGQTRLSGRRRAAGAPPGPPGAIRFERVGFSYTAGEPVLKDVSFELLPGRHVAIVGATGSGKSTIVNLLLRFYDVQEGRITIDGIDIREMDLRALRGLFGLVLQDVYLFSGTIAGNVRLGDASMSDDDVRRALEAVHAAAFVDRLPQGIHTPVTERGSTLSVGQKQLVSCARALAFDPAVLILDEATSSVDTETEIMIRSAIATLMDGRTTLAIAHRLSTIQRADRIVVLHRGELREQGTHAELLASRGIYRRLYELQLQPAAAGDAGGEGRSETAAVE